MSFLPDCVNPRAQPYRYRLSVNLVGEGQAPAATPAKVRTGRLGVVVWAVAHLLVNGDLASLVLFAALGLWALAEMAVINRAEGPWSPPAQGHDNY